MRASIANIATPQTAPDGFVLVAVLWILGTLSALVSIYAVYIINTATGFAVHDDRLRAEALVSAAIEITAYRQIAAQTAPTQSPPEQSARPQSVPTHGRFSFQLGQANVAVEFQSEAARIDLNAAPKPLLVGLFLALGARRDDAENYGDRIIAWRTPPSNGQNSEASAYRMTRVGYEPRGAKFPHTGELSLVRELPTAVVERALPFLTVYSGRPQVNILDAAPEVIGALPGMTPERLNAVLTKRRAFPENGQALLPLLGPAQQFATTEGSKALRVIVRIVFDNGRQAGSEVIILLSEKGDKPFAVLSWRDELYDASTNNPRRAGL